MRFLVILALVVLAVAYIRADNATELANKEVVKQSTEIKERKCTDACIWKMLLRYSDLCIKPDKYDNFLKAVFEGLIEDEDEDEVDEVLRICDKKSNASCKDYFQCVDAEFKNENISFDYMELLGSKD